MSNAKHLRKVPPQQKGRKHCSREITESQQDMTSNSNAPRV